MQPLCVTQAIAQLGAQIGAQAPSRSAEHQAPAGRAILDALIAINADLGSSPVTTQW